MTENVLDNGNGSILREILADLTRDNAALVEQLKTANEALNTEKFLHDNAMRNLRVSAKHVTELQAELRCANDTIDAIEKWYEDAGDADPNWSEFARLLAGYRAETENGK